MRARLMPRLLEKGYPNLNVRSWDPLPTSNLGSGSLSDVEETKFGYKFELSEGNLHMEAKLKTGNDVKTMNLNNEKDECPVQCEYRNNGWLLSQKMAIVK